MTIGAPGDTDCLDSLSKCRDEVASALGVEPKELGLSMGMSNDYEVAIAKGSTNVRVGSTIFGARDYSDKKKASSFFANTSYFEIGVWLVDMFFKLVTN
jgi:hypothetical protein